MVVVWMWCGSGHGGCKKVYFRCGWGCQCGVVDVVLGVYKKCILGVGWVGSVVWWMWCGGGGVTV